VIKFNVIESSRFDYRKIVWARETDAMREDKETRRLTPFNV